MPPAETIRATLVRIEAELNDVRTAVLGMWAPFSAACVTVTVFTGSYSWLVASVLAVALLRYRIRHGIQLKDWASDAREMLVHLGEG